jgi:hypothetical protein
MTGIVARRVATVCLLLSLATPVVGQGLPDPSQMHGRALPAGELAPGTVTVRVVREAVSNNLPGQTVTVTAGSVSRTATTDESGRAEFTGLPQGAEARAQATVDGETLTSDSFTIPQSGGVRMILVAGLSQLAERRREEDARQQAQPPTRGSVVLGANSRILMEFQDDTLQVFYILEIVNNADTRVDIGGPLAFDLPTEASGAATLEGSAQQASINGTRVTVTGPFAPGVTSVQLGFSLPNVGSSYQFRQTLPVALERVTVALQRVGAVSMTSSQFESTGDVRSESGSTFMLGSGPALAAGAVLAVDVTGIPAHSAVPAYAALSIAGAIVLLGGWLAFGGRMDAGEMRRRLVARRDTLLGDLAHLEQRRRAGQETPRDAARRTRVLAELEQIYGELDEAGVGPQGGGEGVAA